MEVGTEPALRASSGVPGNKRVLAAIGSLNRQASFSSAGRLSTFTRNQLGSAIGRLDCMTFAPPINDDSLLAIQGTRQDMR